MSDATIISVAPTDAKPTARAWYALAMMVASIIVGFIDRVVLYIAAPTLMPELHLTDTQFGIVLALGPGLFGAVAALPLGWLSDRAPRQLVLAGCILVWSIATAACGLATTYEQLLVAAVAVGVGESVLTPIIFSLVPDLFHGRSRTTANLVAFAATLLGVGVGYALAGPAIQWIDTHHAELPAIISHFSGWRIAFFFGALLGVPLALAVAAIGPVRRVATTAAAVEESGSLSLYLRRHGGALGGLLVATCLCALGVGATGWVPIYVVRELKATKTEAGIGVGAVFAGGAVAGLFLSAIVVRLLDRRFGRLAAPAAYGTFMLIALPLIALLPFVQTPIQCFIVYGAAMTATAGASALTPNMMQDISPVGLRGRILATWTVTFSIAAAVPPAIVGAISDALKGREHALAWAMALLGVPMILLGVLVLRLTVGAFRRAADELAPA